MTRRAEHDVALRNRLAVAPLVVRRSTHNPYLDLFYGALEGLGFEVVRDGRLRLGWLWRSRRTVRFIHFHWRPDNFYAGDDGDPGSAAILHYMRSRTRVIAFAGNLMAARLLGYRIVWTVHEVYPPAAVRGSARRRR